MRNRPLIIGPEEQAQVKEIVEYAKAHVLPCNKLLRMSKEANQDHAIGVNMNTRMEFPMGYRVVYSQEEQPVHGICHHISISIDEVPEKEGDVITPGELAVDMIMNEFGMKTTVKRALFIYTEPLEYGGRMAINIIEPLERRRNGQESVN